MRPPKIDDSIVFEPIPHSVDYIFPTPLLRRGLRLNHEQVANDCINLIEEIKKTESDPKRYYTNYFFPENRIKMTELPWFTSFANQVKDTYIEYIRNQFGRQVGHLTRHDLHLHAWASVWEEGIHHGYHNHQDSYISGTYYPVNEGGQGIRFQSPHIQSQFIHTTGPEDVETCYPNTMGYGAEGSHMEIVVTPIEGETLMWPSNLLHTVNEQEGEYKRVAISFNLKHNDPIDDTHHGTELSYEFLQY